jgi:integrase
MAENMATIRKRVWETKDGAPKVRWLCDYRDAENRRRFETFLKKKDAEARLTDIRSELKLGIHTPSSDSLTVAEAAKIWLTAPRPRPLERATLRNYEDYVNRYIVPLLGRYKLSKLSTALIVGFRDAMLKRTSPVTTRKVLLALKGTLKEAKLRGLVAQNNALDVTVEIDDRDEELLEIGRGIPTKEEVRTLIDASTGRWRPFIHVLAFAGLRASEARGLTWDDVDLDASTITIRQRADRFNAIGRPKSKAGRRTIPLGPMVTNVLKEWRRRLPVGKSGLVFPSQADTPMLHSNIVNLWFRPLQKKVGIVDRDGRPKYGLHILRHFAASHWIDLEFQPKQIQTMMGHASITMTYDRYGHLFPSHEADQAKLAKGELSILG